MGDKHIKTDSIQLPFIDRNVPQYFCMTLYTEHYANVYRFLQKKHALDIGVLYINLIKCMRILYRVFCYQTDKR